MIIILTDKLVNQYVIQSVDVSNLQKWDSGEGPWTLATAEDAGMKMNIFKAFHVNKASHLIV